MNDYLFLVLGVAFAGFGGEFFVRGTVGLAHSMRIAPGIVAATVAAFATSSPELSVSISSALAGAPQIALGDALGSNVVNVALILGIALSISGIQGSRNGIKRDFPVSLLVPIFMSVLFIDGTLSRIDGILMMCAFLGWLVATVIDARKQRSAVEEVLGAKTHWSAILACIAGLALLIAAGHFIVTGATGIAHQFGIGEFVIGATVVAVGTSVPELATSVIAKLRGHDEVGIGTILGSNIFNGLFIVAAAAIIHPITVDLRSPFAALGYGLVSLLACYPSRNGFIGRGRGVVLLILYACYVATVIQLGRA